MSTDISSTALLELALDLASSLSSKDRFDRLLDTVRKVIACDAVALLTRQGDTLKPLALQGLMRDTLGRRFMIAEHPRFDAICASPLPLRFAADCPLPDPYDGLLLVREGDLPVHACMGLPLMFDDTLIGVLTLDSLSPNVFDKIPERTLSLISAMAAATLNSALNIELLEKRAQHSQQVLEELNRDSWMHACHSDEMIGASSAMTQLKNELATVASSNFTVLISGETGTGKELVARSLHRQSPRSHEALVHINCAALPDNLIESELFGHIKGAFTGAERDRAGKFAIADGGTLFLDEIGELPLAAQSKLLRALQSGEIQPVGQDKIEQVDVRVVAATNRDLEKEVSAGRFRADLYHRLSVYPVTLPALRKREGDIDLLSGFFAERARRKLGIKQLKISSESLHYLNQYDWPGNVRELEHVIDRAALKARARLGDKDMISISPSDCGSLMPDNRSDKTSIKNNPVRVEATETLSLRDVTEDFQRQLISQVLREEKGNWAAAARRLQTDRANLNRLAKRLNILVSKHVISPGTDIEY